MLCTSAGALVASLTANGVTPEQMMRVVNDQVASRSRTIELDGLLRPNYREFAAKGVKFPFHLGASCARWRATGSFLLVDLAIALADALPSGVYSGVGVEEYVREVLSTDGRSDDFRELGNELYLAATDLDTCERIALGAEGWDDVPISSRCAPRPRCRWSTSRTGSRTGELVDGGIVSTT